MDFFFDLAMLVAKTPVDIALIYVGWNLLHDVALTARITTPSDITLASHE
jgi:hypothetical protein